MCYLKFPHLLSSQFEAYVDEDPLIDRFNSHRIVLSINWQAARMLQGQLLWICCTSCILLSKWGSLCRAHLRVYILFLDHKVIIASFAWVFSIGKASVASKNLNTKESYCIDIIVERNCTTVSTIILSLNLLFFISKCAVCNCLEERKPLSIIILAPFLLS